MLTFEDLQAFKQMGLSEEFVDYYKTFVKPGNESQKIFENYSQWEELDIPIYESMDNIGGNPEVVVNIPSNGNLTLNFAPDLNSSGELTDSIEEELETVKSDPFDISPIVDPDDPQAYLNQELEQEESVEEEDDTPRFMTIQDLM